MSGWQRLVIWSTVGVVFALLILAARIGMYVVDELLEHDLNKCFDTAEVCEQQNGRWYPYSEPYS